jgi:hypothetical protein
MVNLNPQVEISFGNNPISPYNCAIILQISRPYIPHRPEQPPLMAVLCQSRNRHRSKYGNMVKPVTLDSWSMSSQHWLTAVSLSFCYSHYTYILCMIPDAELERTERHQNAGPLRPILFVLYNRNR